MLAGALGEWLAHVWQLDLTKWQDQALLHDEQLLLKQIIDSMAKPLVKFKPAEEALMRMYARLQRFRIQRKRANADIILDDWLTAIGMVLRAYAERRILRR